MALFLNQLLYILGLNASSPTYATIWQPSQPVFTAAVSMTLRIEKVSVLKLAGIASAVAGAVFVRTRMFPTLCTVLGSPPNAGTAQMVAYGRTHGSGNIGVATALLACNCLAMAIYVVRRPPQPGF